MGGPTVRRALAILQSILQLAVKWGELPANPVRAVRKPSQRATRPIRVLVPSQVEAARSALLATGHVMDATLVSILAYAGLRPGEAIALRWADVGERTIRVERAVAFGEVKATKTGATRSVRPLAPLASDLREWLLARGRPEGSGLVFPAADGRPWREHDWRNWRRRRFEPAMRAPPASRATSGPTTCGTASARSFSGRG